MQVYEKHVGHFDLTNEKGSVVCSQMQNHLRVCLFIAHYQKERARAFIFVHIHVGVSIHTLEGLENSV